MLKLIEHTMEEVMSEFDEQFEIQMKQGAC